MEKSNARSRNQRWEHRGFFCLPVMESQCVQLRPNVYGLIQSKGGRSERENVAKRMCEQRQGEKQLGGCGEP